MTQERAKAHEDGDEDNIDKQGGRGGHDASIGKAPRRLGDALITMILASRGWKCK